MTMLDVSKGENVVTQGILVYYIILRFSLIILISLYKYFIIGEKGDYFYVVGAGTYTVLVDNKPVAQLGDGHHTKSFGELSVIYDIPRQATVRADGPGSLFALDRATYQFTIANCYEAKSTAINEAVKKVPLLQNLTPPQMEKLVETVELAVFREGNYFPYFPYYFLKLLPHFSYW